MSCKCAKFDMDEGFKCSVSGDSCVFMVPNSKRCAEMFGEGPDVKTEAEDVTLFDYVNECIKEEENNSEFECCDYDWNEEEEE